MRTREAAARLAKLVVDGVVEDFATEMGMLGVTLILTLPNPGDPRGFHNVLWAETQIPQRDFWLAVHDASRRRLAALGVTTAATEVPS